MLSSTLARVLGHHNISTPQYPLSSARPDKLSSQFPPHVSTARKEGDKSSHSIRTAWSVLSAPSKRQDDAPRLSERGRLPALEGVALEEGRYKALGLIGTIGFRIVEEPGMRAGRRVVV
ncbi:uncharacterized protein LAJ45_01478 [Morchella importuna]|uniref:uncharacterized protein n=1 Tax=Morchella importuna TaxID=1174673 RepID=UPI001E8E7B63|nr:uncharacterized protein LAJ45_01478 [Morchella importuna]KAH8154946.1 hypothetical protein LAJ45_01478 [Morchella importuna]